LVKLCLIGGADSPRERSANIRGAAQRRQTNSLKPEQFELPANTVK
jgi:hypothetical protein